MKFLLMCFALLPIAALSESPMSAADFDAYTRGKVLNYGVQGDNYGVEEYLSNRRVRWSFLDGRCKDGYWYEDGPQICFVYENAPQPQCWLFYHGPTGLSARFASGENPTELYEVDSAEKMLCLGPEVGV